MAEKYAVRNLRLCTKDCLCLYVCPTGATDTENSIIDPEKCIGCGACAEKPALCCLRAATPDRFWKVLKRIPAFLWMLWNPC